MKNMRLSAHLETCTSCAGTMILEMAALSRLTGEPIFEEKSHHAMDELWRMRHRSSDLMGTVLNVHSGDWVRYFIKNYKPKIIFLNFRFVVIQGWEPVSIPITSTA